MEWECSTKFGNKSIYVHNVRRFVIMYMYVFRQFSCSPYFVVVPITDLQKLCHLKDKNVP
jgi:hypothetical protein